MKFSRSEHSGYNLIHSGYNLIHYAYVGITLCANMSETLAL